MGDDLVALHELEAKTNIHILKKTKTVDRIKDPQETESAKLKFYCFLLFTLGAKKRQMRA